MKRYTAAQARQQFSSLLDTAEQGESVIIERRGVHFRMRVEPYRTLKTASRRAPMIELIDPTVTAGQWSWDWRPEGLRFVATKRGRRR